MSNSDRKYQVWFRVRLTCQMSGSFVYTVQLKQTFWYHIVLWTVFIGAVYSVVWLVFAIAVWNCHLLGGKVAGVVTYTLWVYSIVYWLWLPCLSCHWIYSWRQLWSFQGCPITFLPGSVYLPSWMCLLSGSSDCRRLQWSPSYISNHWCH